MYVYIKTLELINVLKYLYTFPANSEIIFFKFLDIISNVFFGNTLSNLIFLTFINYFQ